MGFEQCIVILKRGGKVGEAVFFSNDCDAETGSHSFDKSGS